MHLAILTRPMHGPNDLPWSTQWYLVPLPLPILVPGLNQEVPKQKEVRIAGAEPSSPQPSSSEELLGDVGVEESDVMLGRKMEHLCPWRMKFDL